MSMPAEFQFEFSESLPFPEVDLSRVVDGTIVTIAVAGDIDLTTAAIIRRHLEHTFRSSPSRLIIDLTKVTFLGSEGVALLIELHKVATALGTVVVLRGTTRRVTHQILRVTGLASMFVVE